MQINEIEKRLRAHFPEGKFEINDLSGTGSKIEIQITSHLFTGLSRIQQHQKVMAIFDSELKSGELHALTLKTKVE